MDVVDLPVQTGILSQYVFTLAENRGLLSVPYNCLMPETKDRAGNMMPGGMNCQRTDHGASAPAVREIMV